MSNPALLFALLPCLLTPTLQEGEDLSKAFEAIRADVGAPGVVGLIVQEGEFLGFGAAGVRAAGSEDPIELGDPIHLGSCSKAMTATLAARLVEEGVLSWDTTVAGAMPELAKGIDEGFHDVTLIDLLRHRGGIAERRRSDLDLLFPRMQGMEGTASEVRRKVIALAMTAPPVLPAEKGYDYSNYGYMTVGTMLETLTEKSWDQLMHEKLFEPLGMKSAGIGSPAGDGVPVGHVKKEGAWEPLLPGPAGFLPDAMAPAGLLHANLMDWARFVGEHLAGSRDESEFLEHGTWQTLQSDPVGGGYAAGWGLSHHVWSWGEGDVLTHNGSDNTWFSLVFAMPEWDLVVVTACNAAGTPGQRACERTQEALLEAMGYRD